MSFVMAILLVQVHAIDQVMDGSACLPYFDLEFLLF